MGVWGYAPIWIKGQCPWSWVTVPDDIPGLLAYSVFKLSVDLRAQSAGMNLFMGGQGGFRFKIAH